MPGLAKAFLRSCIAKLNLRNGPKGKPKDFKSASVNNNKVSKSICCFWKLKKNYH